MSARDRANLMYRSVCLSIYLFIIFDVQAGVDNTVEITFTGGCFGLIFWMNWIRWSPMI